MALSTTSGKMFPFFQLPRELRNLVYDNLKETQPYCCWLSCCPPCVKGRYHRHCTTTSHAVTVLVERILPHALLICRQLEFELESQVSKPNTMFVPILSINASAPWSTLPETMYENITRLEISFTARCWKRRPLVSETQDPAAASALDGLVLAAENGNLNWSARDIQRGILGVQELAESLPNLRTTTCEIDTKLLSISKLATLGSFDFAVKLRLAHLFRETRSRIDSVTFRWFEDASSLVNGKGEVWRTWDKEKGWKDGIQDGHRAISDAN